MLDAQVPVIESVNEPKESPAAKELAEAFARELDADTARIVDIKNDPKIGRELFYFERRPSVIAAAVAVMKEQGKEKGEKTVRDTFQIFSQRLHQVFVILSKGYENQQDRDLQRAVRGYAADRLGLERNANPVRAISELIQAATFEIVEGAAQ